MVDFKTVTVDGETRVEAWVDGVFKEDADINSQFSKAEAKAYFRQKYM
jgi:hypothetical protein